MPWLKRLADDCHDAGRRGDDPDHPSRPPHQLEPQATGCRCSRPRRSASLRTASFPKEAEDWDLARIVGHYAAAAERMQAAGLDGIEIEAYGHLLDGFWSPATNRRTDDYGGSLDNRLRFTFEVLDAIRARGRRRLHRRPAHGGGRGLGRGPQPRARGSRSRRRLAATGQVDFLNVIRGHIDTDAGAQPTSSRSMGMPLAPRISTSPARCAPPPASRSSTPRASTTSRPRATPSPPASSTWSA